MGWAGCGKARGPECRGPEFQTKFKKNNFSVTVKIWISGYQTLECLLQHSQLMECMGMGVLCRWVKLLTFADFGL